MKRFVIVFAILVPLVCSARGTATWVDADRKLSRNIMPSGSPVLVKEFGYTVWKGERLNAEAVFRSDRPIEALVLEPGALRCQNAVIGAEYIKASFLSYVTGDELVNQYNQCGARDTINFKSIQVPDLIDDMLSVSMEAGDTQPVWLSINVPSDAVPGKYKGTLSFVADGKKMAVLEYSFTVSKRVLPPLQESPFHLDLWQNPYAVARYYDVPLWSWEHFKYLRPVMKLLADAGQKVITTTIMDRPWNGQTEDPFGPMVTRMRRVDGTWLFDYSVFDKWVEFMMSLGIDEQINCYTMIPWALTFDYFDQASNGNATVHAEPGTPEYEAYWAPFIKDFATHLKDKGWFDRTYIAMDERPEKAMDAVLRLIRKVEPGFKVALAGNYHPSIAGYIDDLCITLGQDFPEGVVASRRAFGKISTYYTCCSEKYPNTFLASTPSEATWLPWLALARGADGYLRWAFNSWTADPLHDARFRTWPAGDCYMVYPGGRSSVRFEKLREGLQDYFKATILMQEWGPYSARTKSLEETLGLFTVKELENKGPRRALEAARQMLDR